jgi:hypothetical protein
MRLRYAFRLYPDAGQRTALARAFGCARVVFDDAVRAREDAREAGQPFPTAGQLSRKLITEAKRTKERSWLGAVSAVVLQQSLTRGTGTIEADHLNGEIVLLGRLHGVPTPLNELLQRLANTFARERRPAGSMPVAELVRQADEAERAARADAGE